MHIHAAFAHWGRNIKLMHAQVYVTYKNTRCSMGCSENKLYWMF